MLDDAGWWGSMCCVNADAVADSRGERSFEYFEMVLVGGRVRGVCIDSTMVLQSQFKNSMKIWSLMKSLKIIDNSSKQFLLQDSWWLIHNFILSSSWSFKIQNKSLRKPSRESSTPSLESKWTADSCLKLLIESRPLQKERGKRTKLN